MLHNYYNAMFVYNLLLILIHETMFGVCSWSGLLSLFKKKLCSLEVVTWVEISSDKTFTTEVQCQK